MKTTALARLNVIYIPMMRLERILTSVSIWGNNVYITGADAMACIKSTSYNLVKAGYKVHVISDCVTSYDLKKLDEMFAYYAGKGCDVKKLGDYTDEENTV